MITVHCVDVSGSMSAENLREAQKQVLQRFKPRDIVAFFSIGYHIISDLERPFDSYDRTEITGLWGGTLPRRIVQFAKDKGAKTIAYSDGFILDQDKALFDEFVVVL